MPSSDLRIPYLVIMKDEKQKSISDVQNFTFDWIVPRSNSTWWRRSQPPWDLPLNHSFFEHWHLYRVAT